MRWPVPQQPHTARSALADLRQHLEPQVPVLVAQIDRFAPVAPRGGMLRRTGKLDPQRSCRRWGPPGHLRHVTRPGWPSRLTPVHMWPQAWPIPRTVQLLPCAPVSLRPLRLC